MKLNIIQKLLIVTILPIITLLVFSISHYNDKYEQLIATKTALKHLQLIRSASELLHELQLERGRSAMYLNKSNTQETKEFLQKQIQATNKQIKAFQNALENLDKETISLFTQKYIQELRPRIDNIDTIRTLIEQRRIDVRKPFNYFTLMNDRLIKIIDGFKIYTHSKQIEFDIFTLYKLIQFQELAGQERALVSNFIFSNDIPKEDIHKFYDLLASQDDSFKQLSYLLNGHGSCQKLQKIYAKYAQNHFAVAREKIVQYDQNNSKDKLQLNSFEWFDISSQRINEIHQVEQSIFDKVSLYFQEQIKQTEDALVGKIGLTIFTILLLLASVIYLANNLNNAITEIESGLINFFNFLNYKAKKPKNIEIKSKDELYAIAQTINNEIKNVEQKLQEDKEFIKETTHILKRMQDGDFSKSLKIQPNNPNLKELKEVFNDLVQLIATKIQKQTESLEQTVYEQTLSLQNQVEALSLAKEEALQAQQTKDRFLTNISNELTKPLQNISQKTNQLIAQTTDTKILENLHFIEKTSQSLLNITYDMLQFAKLDKAELELEYHEIDPVKELSDTIFLFASHCDKKELQYNVYIDPKLPSLIRVDMPKIRQIVTNLLSNAVKFTPEDGVIKIYAIQEKDNLVISVKDNGIGISKEQQEKIFNAYESQRDSMSQYKGSGLGLSVSFELAKLMKAQLKLKSDVGKGSIFTLSVPMVALRLRHMNYLSKTLLNSYTIALLKNEKNFTNMNLIKKYLSDFGAKNVIFLDKYQDHGYDLLFFTPDVSYNQQIVQAKIPAVALQSLQEFYIYENNIKHLFALQLPLTPITLAKSISHICAKDFS